MRFRDDKSGQALVLTAVSMSMILGVMGLAIDAGLLFRARRQMQIAADGAAVAAATSYKHTGSVGTARTAGQNAGVIDGVPATSGVTINCPPTSGPNTGGGGSCNGYFEAIVNEPSPTFFMRLFKIGSVTVAARAVAGTPSASNACVVILNPSASDAMELQGSFTVNASSCGIVVDSSDPDALQFTGGGGTLTAGSVAVVGGDGGQTGDSSPAPVTGAAPMSDPISLTGPTPSNGGCSAAGDGFSGMNGVNSSGVSGAESGSTDSSTTSLTGNVNGPGGPGNAICYTKAVSINNATLGQGIYVFENGVTVGGNVTSGAGGTTLDIYGGSFTISTGTTLGLVAPQSNSGASYETNGIALMEPANNGNQITIQKGDASGSLNGIIYAPSAKLFLQDSGGDKSGGISLTTDLIVNELFDKTATLTINSYASSSGTYSPLTQVTLVE
jgi:hypothetical protein